MRTLFIIMLTWMIAINLLQAQTEENNEHQEIDVETYQRELQSIINPSSGDFFDGLSKKITFDRMIPPYGLEVTFDKTVCAHKGE